MMFDFNGRLRKLRGELKKIRAESLLVTSESNVTYLSGFTGNDSVLLITPDAQFFLTDSRYTQEAKACVKNFTVMEVTSSLYQTIGEIVRSNRIKTVAFEGMNLSYQVARNLEGYVGGAKTIPTKNIIERLRAVKDKEEIARISASVRMLKAVLKETAGGVRPGVSEEQLSRRAECSFIEKGAHVSFATIVACGKNSSKPHAYPTANRIAKNDAVMIDMGCKLKLYNSDMTRMVMVGKVSEKIKEIYSIVHAAQEKALEKIKPGRKIADIDICGRKYIADKGYGKFFGHSMGHGVGLDVHEEPGISRRSTDILTPGMVFTVEPAIYIPGIGGVRIEDMVLVTDAGCRVLTR